MIQSAFSKIVDDYSILECPECCKRRECWLRDCIDPEICPRPEPKEPKGNLNLIHSVGHLQNVKFDNQLLIFLNQYLNKPFF